MERRPVRSTTSNSITVKWGPYKVLLILLLSLSGSSYSYTQLSLNLKPLSESAIKVQIQLKPTSVHPPFRMKYTSEYPGRMLIQLTYQPQGLAFIPNQQECMTELNWPKKVEENCISLVDSFGYFDNPIGLEDQVVSQICRRKTIAFNLSDRTINHTIRDLQPSVLYVVSASLLSFERENDPDPISLDFTTKCAATNSQAPPQFPPQTDLSSYQILDEYFGIAKITLFWRSVPVYLVGNPSTMYQLDCYNASSPTSITTFTKSSNLNWFTGSVNVTLDLSYSHKCIIYSHNRYGVSKRNSTIYIPQRSKIYSQHIDSQVSMPKNGRYIVQWEDISHKISSLYSRINLKDGYYTLYWCHPPKYQSTCQSIEGMKKTRKNVEEVTVGKSGRLFGVSYVLPDLNYSSGISWSNECMWGKLKSPYCDISSARSNPTGTQIIVSWRDKCDSIKASMVAYNFTICLVTPNPVLSSDDDMDSLEKHFPIASLKLLDCNTSTVVRVNGLTEFIFTNVSPGNLYSIKMLVIFNHGNQFQFSNYTEEKLVFTTNPISHFPPRSIFPRLASLIVSMVAFTLMTWVYRQYSKYRKATQNFTKVLEDKLENMINFDSFDSKYLVNRSSCDAQNSVITNLTSTMSYKSSGEPSTAICVSDYTNSIDTDHDVMLNEENRTSSVHYNSECVIDEHFLRSLFDEPKLESTTDLCNDSDDSNYDDELSIDSHSSFLLDILQPGPIHDTSEKKINHQLSDKNQ